jgi:ABC-type enterochelin transport system substrate-binding protein
VVRETEFALARDTAGLYEGLKNQAQKLQSGQLFKLESKQRNEYTDLAKKYLDSAQKKAGDDKKALGVVVKNYKLNPDNVFGPETTATNDPNIVIVGGRNYTRPANFNDAQWAEYKKSVGAP